MQCSQYNFCIINFLEAAMILSMIRYYPLLSPTLYHVIDANELRPNIFYRSDPRAMATPNETPNQSSSPAVDQFANVMSRVPSWYNLGVFLGIPMTELDNISDQYSRAPEGTLRCLIESFPHVFMAKHLTILAPYN